MERRREPNGRELSGERVLREKKRKAFIDGEGKTRYPVRVESKNLLLGYP